MLKSAATSYLLNEQSLQSREAAGGELVAVVSQSQLPVAVVAPAVHLTQPRGEVRRRRSASTARVSRLTSPLSATASDEV